MPKPRRVEKRQAIEVPRRRWDCGCSAVLAYLIDTNIAIHVRDGADAVLVKRAEHDREVLLSVLSLAELQRGAYRDARPRHKGISSAGTRANPLGWNQIDDGLTVVERLS